MRNKQRVVVSTILTLSLVFGLFTALPLTAYAIDADAVAKRINEFDHSGNGELIAEVSGSSVTVTGTVTSASKTLNISGIDAGVTIVWKADYSGSGTILIDLGGEGAFELPSGGSITSTGTGTALYVGQINVTISGGVIRSEGSGLSGGSGAKTIEMSSGLVEAKKTAISAQYSTINVSGGTITSEDNSAITNNSAPVTISGGTIRSGSGVVINNGLDGAVLTISGGLVENDGSQQTISADRFIMTGGTVINPGDKTAVVPRNGFDISGGVVSAAIGFAATGANENYNISGGFVFAYGINTVRQRGDFSESKNHVIDGFQNDPIIGGDAVVCAWNQAAGRTTYNAGTSDDLVVSPSGASAVWALEGGESGIRYANGANTGFFPINSVTVTSSGTAVTPDPTTDTEEQPVEQGNGMSEQPNTDTSIGMQPGGAPWSKASEWAVPELEKAANMGLIPVALNGADFTQPITRAEFAAVSVKVYENLSGQVATPASPNPFTDTNDAEVLKALNVGVTAGTSATTFEPNLLLNREQAASMLARVYKRTAFEGWTLATDADFPLPYTRQAPFADDALISDWARDNVYFMVSRRIINGLGNNLFGPRNTTSAEEAANYASATREQALLISTRMVENLN